MRALVVYYSYEGNTEFIAKEIAGEIKADILKLEPLDEKKHRGFMKFWWGGKQVFTKAKPKLNEIKQKLDDYDLLFIGTPVWAWTYAPALGTFFVNYKIHGKKIALFCCCQAQAGKTIQNMRDKLQENEIIGQLVFYDPLIRNKQANSQKAKDWLRTMGVA